MPKQNSAHITMILDRSGSMSSVATDVIGAVNKFIDDQKAVPGECTWTLVQFDSEAPYEVVADHVSLSQAQHLSSLTYAPRGGTPLLDAIGRGITALGDKLRAMPENNRPGRVVFVVQTDGHENSSREFSKDRIKEMIKHQTDNYNWTFVFLGANQDAIATGGGMGFAAAYSSSNSQSGAGYRGTMRAVSANLASFRANADAGAVMASFSDEQREEAMKS